jgi:MFS family permease
VLIESVKLGNSQARLLAACNSVSYLLFSLIGIPNVERWGRRKMMMYAAAGQCFCYVMITILIRYTEVESFGEVKQKKFASASIAFFFLYYVFFGIGWQGVPVRDQSGFDVHDRKTDTFVTVALPYRNQLTQYEDEGSCYRYCDQLDLQLHGYGLPSPQR